MKTQIVDITPEIAERTLEKNKNNRAMRRSTIQSYAAAMRAGLWRENGEPIILGDGDCVLDGQHRLAAVVESGVTQRMLVVTGVPSSTRTTIDTGLRRSSSDILGVEGIPNARNVAACLTSAINSVAGQKLKLGTLPKDVLVSAYLDLEDSVVYAINAVSRAKDASGDSWNSSHWTAALMIIHRQLGQELSDVLVARMCGYGIDHGSQMDYALRRARKIRGRDEHAGAAEALGILMCILYDRRFRADAVDKLRRLFRAGLPFGAARLIDWRQ